MRNPRRNFARCGRFTSGLALTLALLILYPALQVDAQKRRVYKKPAGKPDAKKEEPEFPQRKVTIDKVDPDSSMRVKVSAKLIDRFVDENYREFNVKPSPPTTDEQFVRRVYLDIAGRIPSYRETKQFLGSHGSDKRAELIDDLLDSVEYSQNFYNYFSDVLRLRSRLQNNIDGTLYNEWVKQCLEENKPYNEFVYELLTAEGKTYENPATGYFVRDSGMPLDAMNNTIQVFLGTQIGCAQCHDHPFDRWTQKEFYQIAAFTYGTNTRMYVRGQNPLRRLREELKGVDPDANGFGLFTRLIRGNEWGVSDTKRPLKLPPDYAYDNGKPGQQIAPATLFGPTADVNAAKNPREAFARWLTSSDNPRFTLTIVNRLWKKLFGVGQIEPVDDLRDDSVAENKRLMDFLVQEMIRVDYDMKEFLRILLNTQVYQRQAHLTQVTPGEEYHFPGPILRRMSAEQAWDSFLTLAVIDPLEYQAPPAKLETEVANFDLATVTAKEVHDREQSWRELNGKQRYQREKKYKYKGLLLAKASELPSPTNPGHFLRQFGQSDREIIEGSSLEGNVPQVLTAFNGPVTHMMLEEGSTMYNNVTSEKSPQDRVEVIFLSILNRRPNKDEKSAALKEIEINKAAGYGNVIWALVNTREFLFIQ